MWASWKNTTPILQRICFVFIFLTCTSSDLQKSKVRTCGFTKFSTTEYLHFQLWCALNYRRHYLFHQRGKYFHNRWLVVHNGRYSSIRHWYQKKFPVSSLPFIFATPLSVAYNLATAAMLRRLPLRPGKERRCCGSHPAEKNSAKKGMNPRPMAIYRDYQQLKAVIKSLYQNQGFSMPSIMPK